MTVVKKDEVLPPKPGLQGDLPIPPPKPEKPSLGDLVGEALAAELAKLPIHDGDVLRVARLVHELQQLTDPGSLGAVQRAGQTHLSTVLAAAKAAKVAEQEAKAAALKLHRQGGGAEKTEKKSTENDDRPAA